MEYSLTVELFTELVVGIIVFILRFYARWKYVGFRGFGLDDIFAGIAIIFWVIESTTLYTCSYFGNNIALNPQTALEVPEEDVARLIKGSKLAFIAWVFYILLVWTLKAILLLLYNRLTLVSAPLMLVYAGLLSFRDRMGLWQQKLAQAMIGISAATFLAAIGWHVFSCLPVSKAWQIKPYPGERCTARSGNYIIICILDVVTDLGIMAVPLPMLFQANLSLRRKLVLGVLFSSGTFVIICAILRAYYSLINIESNAVALGWASREVLVATIVVCSPTIKPLVSEAKRSLSDKYAKSRGGSNGVSRLTDRSSPHEFDDLVTIGGSGGGKRAPTYNMTVMGRSHQKSESQDHINTIYDGDSSSTNSNQGGGHGNGIVVKHEFEVSRQ